MAPKQRSHLRIAGLCLLAISAASSLRAADKTTSPATVKSAPTADEIARWITNLDDDHYLAREQATQQLLTAGAAALDPLLTEANGDRLESADRSVWILRRLSTGKEIPLRRQALEHLSNLKKRPQVAAAAREALAEIEHQEALQAIEQLGGRYNASEYMTQFGPNLSGRLILDERWRGGNAGLTHLRHLMGLRHVIIIGTDISAEGLTELKHCKLLQEVWLYGTKLEPADVAKLRKILPEQVVIDYRQGALLGVGSATPDGVGPAIVGRVEPNSAAAAAGIQPNDVIQKFDGEAVPNFKALTLKVGGHHAGDEVSLEVLRNGQPVEFKVKLGQWKTIE